MIGKEEIIHEAKRVFGNEIKAFETARNRIDEKYYEAVKALSEANKIIVSGVGKSGLIGRKISATFSSIGKPSVFMHPVDALHGDIGIVEEGNVVILLSKSGSTKELVRLAPFLKGRGAFIIAISGNGKSYLSRAADITLNASIESEACPLDIVPTTSTTLSLAIGDALAVSVMKMNDIRIEDFIKQHPLGQIGRNNTLQVKDIMHKEEALPVINMESSFRDSVIEITNKSLGCVGVINGGRDLKGIITDGDIRRILQDNKEISGLKVKDIMTKNPICINDEALVGEALSLMENRKSQISVLPVVDYSNKYIGVIRIHDIVRSGI